MGNRFKLKKGLNIPLSGIAEKTINKTNLTETYAIKPPDFFHFTPKIIAKPETKVKAGDILFYNKFMPDVTLTSPVSGVVKEVRRGEKRKILEVIVEADKTIDYKGFQIPDITKGSREDIVKVLLESGCWPYLRQRPYDTIAKWESTPKAIFISGFDSSPLAPDYDLILKESLSFFQNGVDVLRRLTEGKVYLGIKENSVLSKTTGVEINYFSGPHPVGNVGVQIHHTNPVNKGEVVWYVNPQDVVVIGKLFSKGVYDATKVIAITGSEVEKPTYYEVINGFNVGDLIKQQVKNENSRIISGSVLCGTKIEKDGFLSFYDNFISVIPEGNYHELFGWALPGLKKFSPSSTFCTKIFGKKNVVLDTNIHGGKRAFVVTGQYEKYLPMNIYPQHLLKAILAEDIDLMENLGIYEVGVEDFALMEYACSSKIDIQEILQNGIELMIKEVG